MIVKQLSHSYDLTYDEVFVVDTETRITRSECENS